MQPDLITLTNPTSPAAEAYRRLRVNLTFNSLQHDQRALLVVPAGPDSDKSRLLANLAVAFAKVGKRVVLVDCDLRHPAQHTIFGLPNDAGVTSALADLEGRLPLQATEVSCLQVMTSGPSVAVPSDAVASPAMSSLVARLKQEADVLLFDAPPVVVATDAAELAALMDGVVLLVSAGRTKRDTAQRAKEQLAKAGARVIGTVLTNVPADAALRKYLAPA